MLIRHVSVCVIKSMSACVSRLHECMCCVIRYVSVYVRVMVMVRVCE